MYGHPFTTITNSLDGESGLCLGEIVYLVREELAILKVSDAWNWQVKRAYKEPKSMLGLARMSSVSTPYEPSNDGPGSDAFGGVCLEVAYNFGQFRQ